MDMLLTLRVFLLVSGSDNRQLNNRIGLPSVEPRGSVVLLHD
jgi:hypothetical protein